ncbi:MAG: transglycosylase SLT domain-containing protein [Leucothrix sp.]
MGQSKQLSLAIAAAISMSFVTGCSSVGTHRTKAIPNQAAASSPYIVKEEIAFLSATRSRVESIYKTQQHQETVKKFKSEALYQAAQTLLSTPDTPALSNDFKDEPTSVYRRPDTVIQSKTYHPTPSSVKQRHYQPANTQPQVYQISEQDPLLDNPLYEKILLELAGLVPEASSNQVNQPAPSSTAVADYAPPAIYKPHEDMWQHIKNGYQMGNHGYRRQVQQFVRAYGRKPARLQRIANRATNYLHFVVNELKRRRMPTELALLPFVESAYVNTAYSHAGAAGMWQFIPSTGTLYGLKQNRGFDGRMDALESTRAALDYLQKLHREFKGDWFLALAAYNAGEGRVGRAIRYNRARGRKTDYWSLRLPRETREYVPRLLAYKEIIANPRAFGFHLPATPNAPKLAEIHVNKPVNLVKAARYAGLAADALTSLNPNFLKGITTPRVSKRILLPLRVARQVADVIDQLPPERAVSIAGKTRKQLVKRRYSSRKKRYSSAKSRAYKTHKVKRGETLYRIAMRHGITVNKLKRLNGIRSNHIKTGARLRLL